MRFFVGLDIGQAQDYTAMSVLERIVAEDKASARSADDFPEAEKAVYHLRHIERAGLGTPYPRIVARVKELMESELLKGDSFLVVDATGVGAPVVDLLRNEGLNPVPVIITSGDSVTRGNWSYHVPKRDLVNVLQVLLQTGRLKIAQGVAETRTLVNELLNFKVRINLRTAHDSYESWREGAHDDIVLSVALACWFGEIYTPPRPLWARITIIG